MKTKSYFEDIEMLADGSIAIEVYIDWAYGQKNHDLVDKLMDVLDCVNSTLSEMHGVSVDEIVQDCIDVMTARR